MRQYLKAATQSPQEEPGIFVFATCRHFIRTVPVLPRDQKDPDDVLPPQKTTSQTNLDIF